MLSMIITSHSISIVMLWRLNMRTLPSDTSRDLLHAHWFYKSANWCYKSKDLLCLDWTPFYRKPAGAISAQATTIQARILTLFRTEYGWLLSHLITSFSSCKKLEIFCGEISGSLTLINKSNVLVESTPRIYHKKSVSKQFSDDAYRNISLVNRVLQ